MNKELAIQLCNAVNAEMAKGKSYDEAWQAANAGTSEGVKKSWEHRVHHLTGAYHVGSNKFKGENYHNFYHHDPEAAAASVADNIPGAKMNPSGRVVSFGKDHINFSDDSRSFHTKSEAHSTQMKTHALQRQLKHVDKVSRKLGLEEHERKGVRDYLHGGQTSREYDRLPSYQRAAVDDISKLK